MSIKWVTIKKMVSETGYTAAALRSKVARGEFAMGVHYTKSPDGNLQFCIEEYIKWVESPNTGVKSKSRSTGTGKDTDRQSTSRSQPQTSSMRVA